MRPWSVSWPASSRDSLVPRRRSAVPRDIRDLRFHLVAGAGLVAARVIEASHSEPDVPGHPGTIGAWRGRGSGGAFAATLWVRCESNLPDLRTLVCGHRQPPRHAGPVPVPILAVIPRHRRATDVSTDASPARPTLPSGE